METMRATILIFKNTFLNQCTLNEFYSRYKWVTDPVYMSQLATTEKFVQQTSAKKNPITGPVYMTKAPRSTEYFDRGVSENFI